MTTIRSYSKDEDPFVLLEEHSFEGVMVSKKYFDAQFENLGDDVLDYFL
jgi:hypothetical protein